MKELRVAVVGTGFMGLQHMEAIKRLPGAQLQAVAEATPHGRQQAEQWLPKEHIYADYKELLEKEEIEVLHICTPNVFHYEVCKAALEQGVHVYCEKPFMPQIEQAQELIALAKAKNLAGGINFNYRGNTMAWEMRERVRSGDAGRSFFIHGWYLQGHLISENAYTWRMDEDPGSPRTIADIGSHWFDLAQFVSGMKIVEVNASLATVHPHRNKMVRENGEEKKIAVPITSDDGGAIQIRFEDGTVGTLMVSQVSGGYKNSIFLSVDCENYSMRWQQETADRLTLGRPQGGEETLYVDSSELHGPARELCTLPPGHAVAWADALRNNIGVFYKAIRAGSYGEKQLYADFEDGLYAMRLIKACQESSLDRQWHRV